jgi:hypothetical protein
MTNLTNKDIEFLSKQDLIGVLRSALDELDVVSSSGAHRSTTYLAVSTIEGLFTKLLTLLKLQPNGGNVPPGWPLKKNGSPKPLNKLSLEDKHKILSANRALPANFGQLYEPLRLFRNYMHPVLELRDQQPIAQSTALLALAALNALIEKYQFRRFVALQEWKLEYGLARVVADNVIDMAQTQGEQVSLLVSEVPAQRLRRMKFDIFVPPGAIFNMVYNYVSRDQFMAARIEGRPREDGRGFDSGRLVCNKWRDWRIIGRYVEGTEPNPRQSHHTIEVILDPLGRFDMSVDDQLLQLADEVVWQFVPEGKLGFMTELGPVSVYGLAVDAR